MVSGDEAVFCWVPVPYLTMVIRSVAFYMTILFQIYSKKNPKKKKKKIGDCNVKFIPPKKLLFQKFIHN
jgi:hypothetical protein